LEKRLVEPQTLKPDSTLEIELRSLAQLRAVHGIEVIEDWTIGLKKDVHVLVGTPRHLRAHTEVLLEKKVAAKRGITTAADALILVVKTTVTIACGLAAYGTIPKSKIHLLGVGCTSSNKKKTKSRDY